MKKNCFIILFIIIVICIIGIFIILKGKDNVIIDNIDLNTMSDSQISSLFYDMPKAIGFVDSEIESYRYRYKSVNDIQEAIDDINKMGVSSDSSNYKEIINTQLKKETDYYYAIYHEYVGHGGYKDTTFKDTYVYFKNSIFNTSNLTINVDVVNNKNKIKELLNIYSYISVVDSGGIKIMNPDIVETSNQYEYSYYYFYTSFGDWGVRDNIKLYKKIITVNKATGEFKISDEKIREVQGKQTMSLVLENTVI